MCKSVRKTEKIRMEEEEDGKGQEGNRMKERVEEERNRSSDDESERTGERVEGGRKRQWVSEKKNFLTLH